MNDPLSPKSKSPNKQKEEEKPMEPLLPLVESVANLEANNRKLAELVDHNNAVILECLDVIEARQWMVMRVLDDIGEDGMAVRTSSGSVDWEHYKQKYIQYTELQLSLMQSPEETEESEDAPPADAVVFGGE